MSSDLKPLFRPQALKPKLQGFAPTAQSLSGRAKLTQWADFFTSGKGTSFKERELLHDFLSDVLVGILGYIGPAAGGARFTFSREKHVQVDGKFADAVLGEFTQTNKFLVAVEGKGPLDPLDRPHAGRKMSAVDQGYRYAINLPCDWIIVTNMREIRLYHKGSDQHTCDRYLVSDLAQDDALFNRFVYVLAAERVVPADGGCHLGDLLGESERIGKELTREYYGEYAGLRAKFFAQLCETNDKESPAAILTATQKLLDRVLFCCFCEDRGLLPSETVASAYGHSDPYNPRPVWENFKGLFRSIDQGNKSLKIPQYNGGLFAKDEVLERLVVPNELCGGLARLAAYDYSSTTRPSAGKNGGADGKVIDVDILGHIFEQSISDLERMRNKLEGKLVEEETKTRRKKEGAFYTPSFVTRYIVSQTLGPVLADRFEALRKKHEAEAKGAAKQALVSPKEFDAAKLGKAQKAGLLQFWDAWQEELGSIRVLDPACGSGAFLIEAFDQLHAAYEACNDRLTDLRGARSLFDLDKHILQNNLYGVDINEEAVEICRLSLWIKTAQYGKVLTSLDHTIRVGNSVVDDLAVHAKAFDWRAAFPEVFEVGGFDAVIGNPPYIRQEWIAPYKPYWETRFQSFNGVADIFTYFYELGIELLRPNGRMGFITSGSWVRGNFGSALRAYLMKNAHLESIPDFGEYQPFVDAEMIRPTITVLKKAAPGGTMRLFKWLTSGTPPQNLDEVIAGSPTMRTDHLSSDTWELETDAVLALRKKLSERGRPLKEYAGGRIYRGVLTGLTEVFILNNERRDQLIADDKKSSELIKPFAQGTHLRPWYMESTGEHILAIKSSGDFSWPWSDAGESAEKVFSECYPAVYAYLSEHREKAIKRQDQGRFWWELRSCAYWNAFDEAKITWPDISKLPRFSMENSKHVLGNTGYFIPGGDYYLLGILSSWVTWFFISKTSQPLRLRADRWQYRLFTQFMENIPIPIASPGIKKNIVELAKQCLDLGGQRYALETNVQKRLITTFGVATASDTIGGLNNASQSWWDGTFMQLGMALKTSFKLSANPFAKPNVADQWEPYLNEKRAFRAGLNSQLEQAQAVLNEHVYRLFELTPEEQALLQKEVEH